MNKRPHLNSNGHGRLCWISSPGSSVLRQCTLLNVDDGCATIGSPTPLPDTFDLFVTLDSKLGRRCNVVSRTGNEVDVQFSEVCEA